MRVPRRGEAGRADAVALVLSLALGAAAILPAVRLRTAEGAAVAREAIAARERGNVRGRGPVEAALAEAAAARALAEASRFAPDPSRTLGPPGATPASPPARIAGLDGSVREGTLFLRWKPVPGAATLVRIEGHGGPGVIERRIPAGTGALEEPVAGVAGTLVVRAVPAASPAVEERVSIPYRVPVEATRATRASEATQSAMIVLRRPFGGKAVEGEFPVSLAMDDGRVTGISDAGPDGPPVDFRTDLVLEAVRSRRVEIPGTPVPVPSFGDDGRVLRDGEGRPVLRTRAPAPLVEETLEVILRGPGDRRLVLEVEAGGVTR